MKQCFLMLILSLTMLGVSAAGLTTEQVEQQIQLSHMLGQISQKEQNFRIQKVRTLGVDGYYEWLENDSRSQEDTAASSTK